MMCVPIVLQLKGTGRWPEVLKAVIQGGEDSQLALEALGGAVWQLRRSLIDHDLVSMQNFHPYVPPDESKLTTPIGMPPTAEASDDLMGSSGDDNRGRLVLDGVTLANLEIFRNTYDQSAKGSLWQFLNR